MKNDRPIMDIERYKEKFKHIFKQTSPQALDRLIVSENIHFFGKHAVIYSEGARMKGCYFVYEGIVKIYQTGKEGKEQIIKFEKEGNIFGFRSVILKEAACTSVETLTEATLCFIPGSVLLNLLRENSDFAYELMQIACKELGESNRNIKNIAQKSVKKRLAEILTMLADDFGTEPDGQLKLTISREDLSNFIGTATETVIRLLSEYKSEGLVEAKGRRIKLLNVERLKKIAEG